MPELSKAALKAAKKSLKKQESGEMKLKALVSKVAARVRCEDHEKVKEWISNSSKFVVEGKKVTLKRRRSSVPTTSDPAEEKVRATKKIKTVESVSVWRKEHKILVLSSKEDDEKEDETYEPFTSFEACQPAIAPALIAHCTGTHGFAQPSPIQAQSWPVMTTGANGRLRDVVGIAETGSGKTLAFALPALTAMAARPGRKTRRLPRMLVLSPTRELAMQSAAVLEDFGAVVGVTSLVVYGGVPKHTQVAPMTRKEVDCVTATPGRLKDLINDGVCDFSQVQHVVLDEADRMLDMGFEEDVRFILNQCSYENRQTVMFSATWPVAIQAMAAEYQRDPVRIYVGVDGASVRRCAETRAVTVDDSLSANRRVRQHVEVIDDRQREARLRKLLRQVHGGRRKDRVLVFALYKKEAERLEYSLKRDGWNCCSIHGNKNQNARQEALQQFKKGTCPLLVATDVAARGLDIPNVETVINYTFPLTIEDYVHRIGRTGRAGRTGVSYTFFQPTDKAHAGALQQLLRQVGQPIPDELAKFGSTIKRKEHKLYGNFGPRSGGEPMKQATKITFNHDD